MFWIVLKSRGFTSLLFFIGAIHVLAQPMVNFKEDFQYEIKEAQGDIKVDGLLDDEAWDATPKGGDFWQKVPYFQEGANPRTEFMLTYDEDYLYIAAKCFQKEEIIIRSLKRDEYWDNDGIAIILDPLNAKINSTLFGTSAVGVQWDAVRSETLGLSADWSNKWFVETHITDSLWTAEFAIPFKILRYNKGNPTWGMNFVRNITARNEYHNWTSVPEGFWPPNAAFAGALNWDQSPEPKKGNYNIIPYAVSGLNTSVDQDPSFDYDLGLDAKVAVTSAVNLDLTVNPDFSQVEVDQLVTNLTRFNIGLPERRNFFLENADVFAGFGTDGVRPFFSRRIGLDENLRAVPIIYGARLTGDLSPDVRIGVMNVQSGANEDGFGQNQSAVSLKKQFGRSYIQGLFLNRESTGNRENSSSNYGRNLSLEGAYLSDDGQQLVYLGLHNSMKEGQDANGYFVNLGGALRNQTWEFNLDNVLFQKSYYADMGFTARINNYDAVRDTTIRVGYQSSDASLHWRYRPVGGVVASHTVRFTNLSIADEDWNFNEQSNSLSYSASFRNTMEMQVRGNFNRQRLLFPFGFTDAEPLPAGVYQSTDVSVSIDSDERKALAVGVEGRIGGFYNGNIRSFRVDANYRVQPWGNFGLGYQWNDLSFPDPYGEARITALLSRVEIGFTRNLLWANIFQFVDQSDYVGINSRLIWRFSPMSDIFLVYVDNYDLIPGLNDSRSLTNNNRALLFKINYWY